MAEGRSALSGSGLSSAGKEPVNTCKLGVIAIPTLTADQLGSLVAHEGD